MKTAETEDKNKLIKIAAAVLCVVAAAALLYYNYGPVKKYSTSMGYFTDDDGATWYVDSLDNLPPYMHNGKEAVRINVYSYANGSQQFAGFLLKFPDNAKKSIEERAKQSSPPKPAHEIAYAGDTSLVMLVKAPKSNSGWFAMQSVEGLKAATVHSPDGSELESVLPTE